MINIKKIKELGKEYDKKISKNGAKKINEILEREIREIIKKSARNADFAGRKIIKEEDIEDEKV